MLSGNVIPRIRFSRRTSSLATRLAHFLFVWSGLLFIHESGHAWIAERQGIEVLSIMVGAGPVLWRGDIGGTRVSFHLVPVIGLTRVASPDYDAPNKSLASEVVMFGAGILATAAFALLITLLSASWEWRVGTRCVWGRMIVADAIVLTIFNFLPVPPLDAGRAVLAALTTWRAAPLSADALFWTQLSGVLLAVLPMTLWTRWTRSIDSVVMWWRAPRP